MPELKEVGLESPDDRGQAIERFFENHLSNTEFAQKQHDSASAFTCFLLMISHINKWKLTEEEIKTSLKELAKKQAEFHVRCIQKISKQNIQLEELAKVKKCLEIGKLTLPELDLTDAEKNIVNEII